MTPVKEKDYGLLEVLVEGKIRTIIIEQIEDKVYKYKLINGKNKFPIFEKNGNITPDMARLYLEIKLGYSSRYIPPQNHKSYSTNN